MLLTPPSQPGVPSPCPEGPMIAGVPMELKVHVGMGPEDKFPRRDLERE